MRTFDLSEGSVCRVSLSCEHESQMELHSPKVFTYFLQIQFQQIRESVNII